MAVENSTPVIVGVGQHCPAKVDFDGPCSPVDLAAAAARQALADSAQGAALARELDVVVFMKLFADMGFLPATFGKSTKPARSLVQRLGIDPPRVVYSAVGGNLPQKMINDHAAAIVRGDVKAVLLAGGEALRTTAQAQRAQVALDWNEDPPGDMVDLGPPEDMVGDFEYAHGVGMPIWSYPLFENAIRHRRGRSAVDHSLAIGRLFARFNRVAQQNPRAAFGLPRTAVQIAMPAADNRLISFPYTRLMNANENVDQAAAVVMTSVGVARALGIPESRWVYLRGCGDAIGRLRTTDHVDFHSSPALAMAGRRALAMAGLDIRQIDFFDLYSCFPSAVELACAALGIDEDDPRELTVTGGLPFFGGPGNAYVLHAVAEMADWLRTGRGRYGLVTGNGGFMSSQSVGIYSTLPAEGRWTREDPAVYQAELDAQPAPRVELSPQGPGSIETYTVIHERGEPARGVIVGRLRADDARFVANTPSGRPDILRWLMADDPIGTSGVVTHGERLNTFVPDHEGNTNG